MRIFYGRIGKTNAYILSTIILLNMLLVSAVPVYASPPMPPVEILEKRTENSKTFLNEDGTYTAKIHMNPIHYKEKGSFEDIDNSLVISDKDYKFENKANAYKVKFKKSIKDPSPIHIEKDGYSIDINIPASTSNALSGIDDQDIANDNKLFYKDKANKATIRHTVLPEKIKEDILLFEKPSSDKFIYELTAPGLEVSEQKDGSVSLKNSSDKIIAKINPMIMYEGLYLGEEKEMVQLDLTVTKNGDTSILTYTDTKGWLAKENRSYPVTVDPTIILNLATFGEDSQIRDFSYYPYYNYGAQDPLRVTKTTSPNQYERRSMLKLNDLGDVPFDANIVSASFNIYAYYDQDGQATFDTNRILHDWKEGTGTQSANTAAIDGVTWYEREYGDNANNGNSPYNETDPDWTTPGGDYLTSAYESRTTKLGSGWVNLDMTKIFRQWFVQDINNYGLMVRVLNNGDNIYFYSRESAVDPNKRPYAEVTYTDNKRIGVGSSWTYKDVNVGSNTGASVNVENGNLVVSKTLLSVPGRGVPVTINPTYNSQETASYDSGFGAKWSFGFAPTISVSGASADPVIYKDTTGLEHRFHKNSSGQYFHSSTLNGTLTTASANTYVYKEVDGTNYSFNGSTGKLTTATDVKGNTTSYNYISGNITDASGRVTTASYHTSGTYNGHVDTVKDPAGRTTKFNYDTSTSGYTLLASIVDAYETSDARTISFGYAPGTANLNSITDAKGNTYTFDYAQGTEKVVNIDNPGNLTDTSMTYHSALTTSMTDRSVVNNYEFDKSGNVTKLSQSEAYNTLEQESSYSQNNDLETSTEIGENAPGATSSFSYDEPNVNPNGNVVEEQTPSNGNTVTSTYSYASEGSTGAQNNVSVETHSSGAQTENLYDPESNNWDSKLTVKDGTYLDNGSTYDSYGNPLKQSIPINRTFNEIMNQDFEVDDGSNKPKYWTDYTNDTSPSVVARSSSYQKEGDYSLRIYRTSQSSGTYSGVKSNSLPVSPGNTYSLSTWLYTQSSVNTASAHIYWYKSDGTLSSVKQANSYVIGYHKGGSSWGRYFGQVTAPSDAATAKVMPVLYGEGQAFFDCIQFEEGPIVSPYNPVINGSFENWTSGNADEWAKYGTANFASSTAKISGELSLKIYLTTGSSSPYVSQYVTIRPNQKYSLSGWLRTTSANDARLYGLYYDSNYAYISGTTYEAKLLGSNDPWTIGFVNMGTAPSNAKYLRVVSKLNHTSPGTGYAYFDSIAVNRQGIETVNGYDANQNYLTSTKDTYGNQTTFSYSTAGNQENHTDPHGITTKKGYDLLNRITSIVLDFGGINATTYYSYDKNDNLTSVRDAESTGPGHRETTYSYNEQNQMTGFKDALGNKTTLVYDTNGNPQSVNMPSGRSITNDYDAFNRLENMIRSDNTTISYTRDANGNPLTVSVNQSGSIFNRTYGYNDDQSVSIEREGSASDPNYNLGYTYDADGNPTSYLEKFDSTTLRTINKGFDYQGNLTSVTDANSSVTFNNNANGSPVKQTRTGSSIYTDYDSEARPTDINVKVGSDGATIKRYNYTYDEEGNIESETGSITNNYSYDTLHRLKTWNNGSATTSYNYDKVGNILSVNSGTTISYGYRDDNSLSWKNSGGSTVSYAYDADGNMTTNDTWTYTYDADGRPTQARNGSTTASYSYDDQGRRISKTVNGTVTKYKYEGWNVLREMDSSDVTIAEYTYDPAGKPLSMRRGGATYYYVYNARGDITAVVDTNGTVKNTYTYNPWGKITASSETVTNPYRYASYRYDSETSMYYLQNRYYSPDLMRFITRDAIKDTVGKPSQSNYYHYADGNPVMNIDPNGNCAAVAGVIILWGFKLYIGYLLVRGAWYVGNAFYWFNRTWKQLAYIKTLNGVYTATQVMRILVRTYEYQKLVSYWSYGGQWIISVGARGSF